VPSNCLLNALNVLPEDTTTIVAPQEASELSVAQGSALVRATAGEMNSFEVLTRDPHNNHRTTQTASALAGYIDASSQITLSFTYTGTGNYTTSFTPIEAGNFLMYVLVNGRDIVGSPFSLTVLPGPTSPVHTRIDGQGIQQAVAGVEAFFMVTLQDAQLNERRDSAYQTVAVDDGRFACTDQGAGVFRCFYMITKAQT